MSTHLDEETLFVYIDHASSEDENAAIESHLATCVECEELFASVQEFFQAIGDREVWAAGEIPLPRTSIDGQKVEAAVEASRRMTEGAAESELLLATLLCGAVETWRRRCAELPQLRTPAAVNALLVRSRNARETNPTEALELARIAGDLASTLGPSDSDVRLRGNAWKEIANAFKYLSRYNEALDAVDRAESLFRGMLVSEYDLAAVEYVRGTILRGIGRTSEAIDHARRSRELALVFGDVRKVALATLLEGNCQASAGDWRGARDTFLSALKPVQAQNQLQLLAVLLHNIGSCCKELGDLDAASTWYLQAIPVFQELQMPVETTRVRWNLGRMLLASGKAGEAVARLEVCRADFDRLEMKSEVGLISLDIAEALLVLGRSTEVPAICRQTIDLFLQLGVTQPAMVALAYLEEAIQKSTATSKVVHYIREYLEELPQHEHLLFAPPID